MLVIASAERTEKMLLATEIACPDCAGVLGPYGYGRPRMVRGLGHHRVRLRPRRARCRACGVTHVLLPAEFSAHHGDTTEVIGTALTAHAQGKSTIWIAAELGRPVSTVRGWLSRARGGHADWLYHRAVQHAFQVEPTLLNLAEPKNTTLGEALNLLVGAAITLGKRLDVPDPLWALIGYFAGGRLLGPPKRT